MLYYTYDNSFEGLLTCVFDAFYRKETPDRIQSFDEGIPLFAEELKVYTDTQKSDRVLMGLKNKISASALRMLFVCFLSEEVGVEMRLISYITKTFLSNKSIELNFADPDVLELSKIYKKVMKEKERMKQFVRFQRTADGIYFAYVEPQYDVIPLVAEFFTDRFADQHWIIFDAVRKYGLYYNLETVEEVCFDQLDVAPSGKLAEGQLDAGEIDFQDLWKNYLQSITIKERMNLKLQRQHMPKRFWKHLTEKQ